MRYIIRFDDEWFALESDCAVCLRTRYAPIWGDQASSQILDRVEIGTDIVEVHPDGERLIDMGKLQRLTHEEKASAIKEYNKVALKRYRDTLDLV